LVNFWVFLPLLANPLTYMVPTVEKSQMKPKVTLDALGGFVVVVVGVKRVGLVGLLVDG